MLEYKCARVCVVCLKLVLYTLKVTSTSHLVTLETRTIKHNTWDNDSSRPYPEAFLGECINVYVCVEGFVCVEL